MDTPLRIKFWGTRGLVSSPRIETASYGGNTTCIQVLYKNHLIIVDTGFGASNLGESLMERIIKDKENLQIHIFYTHFHWDHIQGLPFFHPIYFPTSSLNIYSPVPVDVARENLDLLFDGSYSPFEGIDSMPSTINFHELSKPLSLDGLTVDFQGLDHGHTGTNANNSNNTFAFRFRTLDGTTIVIATDHEARPSEINNQLIDFARYAHLFIHDAQYTDQEYKSRVGWGHSTYNQALENGLATNTKFLLLTHHDPKRNDQDIDKVVAKLEKNKRFKNLHFEFAKEGIIYAPVKSLVTKKSG